MLKVPTKSPSWRSPGRKVNLQPLALSGTFVCPNRGTEQVELLTVLERVGVGPVITPLKVGPVHSTNNPPNKKIWPF